MYTLGLDKLLTDAKQLIMVNDRDLYRDYMRVIEESIASSSRDSQASSSGNTHASSSQASERHQVIITGYNAIRLIKSGEIDKDSYVFELYTENPYEFGMWLVHTLLDEVKSPHIPKKTICLMTKIRRRELEIYVFGRLICKLYAFTKMNIIPHPAFDSSFSVGKRVNVCNPLILLIKLYKQIKIADPCPDFDRIKQEEALLVDYSRSAKLGGAHIGNEAADPAMEKAGVCGEEDAKEYAEAVRGGSFNIQQSAADVLNFVKKGKYEYAVVGDYAWKDSNRGRLQIIMSDIDEFFRDFTKQNTRNKYKLAYISTNLPDEWVMKKCSIFLESGEQSVVIADLFNNSEFELIPLQSAESPNYNRADFITIAKIYLIEIWILTTYMTGPKASNLSRKVDDLYDNFYKVRSRYASSNFDEHLLSCSHFVGNYANEAIQKRNIIKERNDFIPPYYPANEKENG